MYNNLTANITVSERNKLIQMCKMGQLANARLSDTNHPASSDEIREFKKLVNRGDDARQQLIESHLYMVFPIAKEYTVPGVDLSDIIQEGTVGLTIGVDAVIRRNESSTAQFASVVKSCIRKSIDDAFISAKYAKEISYADCSTFAVNVDEVVYNYILRDTLFDLMEKRLTPQEERVIKLRYGLVDGHCHTIAEIASELGVCDSRVTAIEHKALRKYRHPICTKRIKEFY